MKMFERPFADIKHNALKYGTAAIAAIAFTGCGSAENNKDPNALVACPEGYSVGQKPLENPAEFLRSLSEKAKRYKVKIGLPGEEICGDEKTGKIYSAVGKVNEARREEKASHHN
jgi:hypothetical protein